MGDFRNAIGLSPLRALPRLLRGLSALRAGIRGTPTASRGLPIRVQLEITDRCNFNCVMCNRNAVVGARVRRRNDLDVDHVIRLIDVIRPAYVTLNGNGEPLLYRGLARVLKACRARGVTTAMPSNMSLMSGERLQALLDHPPTILTCSLYGSNAETFSAVTGARGFERCAANLERLAARLPSPHERLRVLVAVHAGNAGDYETTCAFLSRLGLLAVTGIVPVHDYDRPNALAGTVPGRDAVAAILVRLDRSIADSSDPHRTGFLKRWRDALVAVRARDDVDVRGPCLVPWISTYVDAVGDVRPCCYLSDSRHVMGNVNEAGFEEIWNAAPYRDFRERMTRGREGLDACRRCPRNDADRIRRYRVLAGGHTAWTDGLKGSGSRGQIP